MKKQLTTIIAAALILGSLTACSESAGAGAQPEDQSSVTDSAAHDAENSSSDKAIGFYGETDIPDIPCGDEYNGGAVDDDHKAELEKALDTMVFETHTFGEYTLNLVGDKVRTDKANFPDNIYTHDLRVEVDKNGTKLEGSGCYSEVLLLGAPGCNEYILFPDKIGSYLDMYALENPVIAMRYFLGDDAGKNITKAVEFTIIRNDKIDAEFDLEFAKATSMVSWLGTSSEGKLRHRLCLNQTDGTNISKCRAAVFAADRFKIADNNTLIDEEAGIKHIFDFSVDPNLPPKKVYTTQNLRPEKEPTEKIIGIYGETEIPDIPLGGISDEGKANDSYDWAELEQCLDEMVFETHTFGEYTINLVGERVRTDKENFPDSIYVHSFYIEVEKNGEKIGEGSSYNDYILYGMQFQREFRLLTNRIGSYIDVYGLENPVIAMRYFFDEDPKRTVKETVSFVIIRNDKVDFRLLGAGEKGTVVDYSDNSDLNDLSTALTFNPNDNWSGMTFISAAEKFRIADSKTLIDDEAGIRYTFNFSPDQYDQLSGLVYRVEWIK